jgi:hypothetical protein
LLGNVAGGAATMIGGGTALNALLRGGATSGAARNLAAWALRNPIKAAAAGDAAYGTAYGAGENNDDRLLGAAVGAPVGALGSFAGAGLAKGAEGALQGVVNPAAQRLRDLGIPLSAGEVLGGGWKKAQDALTSVFGPGNMVARRYQDGRRALNEAAFNAAGQVIDTPINAVGQEGINLLDGAKNQAYSDALSGVTLDLNDPQVIQALRSAVNQGRNIPNVDQASDIATGALQNYIGNAAPAGQMTGRDFQQAYRGLSRTARTASDRMYGHEIGQTLGQGQDALVTALESQNPGAYSNFLKANSANRGLSVLTDAVNAAKNQVSDGGEVLFTPAQLGTAATNNAKKYSGKVAAAAGNRPFNQLATDAQQVMSSKLPDSGTPMRLLTTALATGGAGGLGYGADGGEGAGLGLGTVGLLTALGTKKGQQLITAALLKRTLADQQAARMLRQYPALGANLGAGLGVPLLDSPTP